MLQRTPLLPLRPWPTTWGAPKEDPNRPFRDYNWSNSRVQEADWSYAKMRINPSLYKDAMVDEDGYLNDAWISTALMEPFLSFGLSDDISDSSMNARYGYDKVEFEPIRRMTYAIEKIYLNKMSEALRIEAIDNFYNTARYTRDTLEKFALFSGQPTRLASTFTRAVNRCVDVMRQTDYLNDLMTRNGYIFLTTDRSGHEVEVTDWYRDLLLTNTRLGGRELSELKVAALNEQWRKWRDARLKWMEDKEEKRAAEGAARLEGE